MSLSSIDRKTGPRTMHAMLTAGIAALVVMQPLSTAPRAQSAQQAAPELVLQTGHTGQVNAIALSPDGRFLVSGSSDYTLKIWDIASGSVLRTLFGHSKAVLAATISADGRLIASSGEDMSVLLWDVTTGVRRTLGLHTTPVKDVAFSADSRQLVSLGAGELKVWDVTSGRQLRETPLLQERDRPTTTIDPTALALTPDGRLAAMAGGLDYRSGVLGFGGGGRAKPIRVIDVTTGRDVETFKLAGDMNTPTGLRFSPDGRMLAVKVLDSRARSTASVLTVYDVETGRALKTFQSSDGTASGGIEFSPDSKLLASRADISAGPDTNDVNALAGLTSGSIDLFDVVTWRRVRELTKTGTDLLGSSSNPLAMTPLTFSRDGEVIAVTQSDGIALFESSSGSPIRVLRTSEKAAAISAAPTNQPTQIPDELRAIMADFGGLSGDLLDGVRSKVDNRSPINFTPDGKQLSVVGSTTVWDTVAGMPRPRRETDDSASSPLALLTSDGIAVFSPDGKLSATGGTDDARGSTIVVREVATDKVVQTIVLGKSSIKLPRGMPPGWRTRWNRQYRCPGSPSMREASWSGTCDSPLMGGGMFGVDASRLFGGSADPDCHVKLFDPRSGREVRDIRTKSADLLSSSGRFLLKIELGRPNFSGGGGFGVLGIRGAGSGGPVTETQPFTVIATDIETGRKIWEVKGVHDSVTTAPTLTFSPDDSVLAVRTVDKNAPVLNLHNTTSGKIIASIGVAGRTVDRMTFSRDSTAMAITYDEINALLERATRPGDNRPREGGNLVSVIDLGTGRQRFELAHEAPVDGATFSPDGRLMVTIGQDRNESVWDARTGEKLATMVNLEVVRTITGTPDWLVVTPDGLFDGSPAAWQQIMWRFSQDTFDVGPVEIFFNEFYYPGLASEIFAGRRPKAPRDLGQIDRRQPKVTLSRPPAGDWTTRQYTVRVEVAEAPSDASHRDGSGVRDVRLFRNGTLVKVWPGDVLSGRSTVTLEATLPIVAGENRLSAYAFNRENVKSADVSTTIIGGAALSRKGTAYLLALGVNQYANAQYNLRFAAADATAFAQEVKAQQEKLGRFDRVEVIELLDKEATKANLLLALRRLSTGAPVPSDAPAALARLAQAQPEDAVIIYFAGHGTASGARFYLVPHDLGYTGNRTGVDASAIETILAHSVSDLELESAVDGLDAHQIILVIDACNSGQALEAEERRRGPMNSKGLAQLAYEKGMYILTAAQSYQAALETSQLGHGYLTFTLVEEGLKKGMADLGQKDGEVSVREWFDYATQRVPEMQETRTEARLLLDADNKAADQNAIRNLQSPRAFYRRDVEPIPVIIGRP